MSICLAPGYDRAEEVSQLFSEYTDLLIQGDPMFRHYLDLQNYQDELKHLETKYGPPDGRLYLADWDATLAGCIGLKRLDATRCEMKRLYVRPAFRGRHIAETLVTQILRDAREIGYTAMLLDTLPFLENAIHLYQKFGFYEIDCYNNSPMADSIYMQLDL